jgi:tetratricopeptide (TPR) repeat protein
MTASYPRDFAAQNNLGVYYISRNEFTQAAEHYRAAIDIAPDEPLPMSNLAYSLFFLNQRPEAYKWAEKSLAIRPDGDLAVTRWFVARGWGDPEQSAFEAAAKKIASPEQMLGANATLAAWDGRLKDYGRLEEELRAHARAVHDEGLVSALEASERIVMAAYQQGPAIDALKESLAKTASPQAQAQAAAALGALGIVEPLPPVIARLDPLGKQDPAVWVPVAVAKAYVRAAGGQPKEAVSDLQATLTENPRALEINFHIGRIRGNAGDVDGAESSYRQITDAASILGYSTVITGARWKLAEVLIKKGNTAGAKEQLDALLKQWEKADTEFTLLKKVREERKALDSK